VRLSTAAEGPRISLGNKRIGGLAVLWAWCARCMCARACTASASMRWRSSTIRHDEKALEEIEAEACRAGHSRRP